MTLKYCTCERRVDKYSPLTANFEAPAPNSTRKFHLQCSEDPETATRETMTSWIACDVTSTATGALTRIVLTMSMLEWTGQVADWSERRSRKTCDICAIFRKLMRSSFSLSGSAVCERTRSRRCTPLKRTRTTHIDTFTRHVTHART